MASLGRLQGLPADGVPHNARFDDAGASIESRARAYLDVNSGHCHSQVGPADTSGLWLDAGTNEPRQLGLCKPPVAAGQVVERGPLAALRAPPGERVDRPCAGPAE